MEKAVILGVCDSGARFYNENKDRLNIVAFIDDSPEYRGKFLNGVPIYPFQQLTKFNPDKIYPASSQHAEQYEHKLKEKKIPSDKIFRDIIENDIQRQRIQQIANTSLNNCLLYMAGTHIAEYNAHWETLKKKYTQIKIFWIRVGTMGEMLSRYYAIAENEPLTKEKEVLRVFLPFTENGTRICNKALIEMLRQQIYIPTGDEISFWIFVITHHIGEVDISETEKYMSRNSFPTYEVKPYQTEFSFTPRELIRGRQEAERIGLSEPYVCVAGRSATYNNATMGHDMDYAYRNVDFYTYEKMIAYLGEEGFATVKMGKDAPMNPSIENCVDYAGKYSDEWMDIYLAAHAQFIICNGTGLTCLTDMFGIPFLQVNSVPLSFCYGAVRYTDKNYFIPKKYYSRPKKRFLSMREIIDVEGECLIWGSNYARMGIEFIDNTPEELLQATQEFLARLRGEWEDTEGDKKNQARWQEIYKLALKRRRSNEKIWTGDPFPYHLTATFMRDNPYFLE